MVVYELWRGKETGKTFMVRRADAEVPVTPKSPHKPDEEVEKVREYIV